jgi:hypothetical protein
MVKSPLGLNGQETVIRVVLAGSVDAQLEQIGNSLVEFDRTSALA